MLPLPPQFQFQLQLLLRWTAFMPESWLKFPPALLQLQIISQLELRLLFAAAAALAWPALLGNAQLIERVGQHEARQIRGGGTKVNQFAEQSAAAWPRSGRSARRAKLTKSTARSLELLFCSRD